MSVQTANRLSFMLRFRQDQAAHNLIGQMIFKTFSWRTGRISQQLAFFCFTYTAETRSRFLLKSALRPNNSFKPRPLRGSAAW